METEPPSDATIAALFDTPGTPAAGTFELGLALGGTVSAGAYTAGVLDFLVEALDCWDALRGGGTVPTHRALVRFMSGTSGGGVCTAIFARAMNYGFAPVTQTTDAGTAAQNPFYDIWINHLDLADMLSTSDLAADGATIVSVLNAQPLDAAAAAAIAFTGGKRPARTWLADPLRIFLTLTNLNGMPYRLDFGAMGDPGGAAVNLSQSYVAHADYGRFAIHYGGAAVADARPDEFSLDFQPATDWSSFGQYALGTAAFPIGLKPRTLSRPLCHYQYRLNNEPAPVPNPVAGQPAHYWPLIPDWDAIQVWNNGGVPDTITFTVVDGGVCDNEPVELVRTALAGISGCNPRDGASANRAVLMIDPFAGGSPMAPPLPQPTDVMSSSGALINGMLQQMRFDTRDVLLAANPTVFSRFMISAQRGNAVGDPALATSGLGAFIGFACSAFRRHDFMLGRQNCQQYLRNYLVLPIANPLFDGWRGNADMVKAYQVTDAAGGVYLPIIPLTGTAADAQTLDPWPVGKLDPNALRAGLEARFSKLLSTQFAKGPLTDILTWLVSRLTEGTAAGMIVNLMTQALQDAGLLAGQAAPAQMGT
jgi:predicted acylesterase/phospholipase RssA